MLRAISIALLLLAMGSLAAAQQRPASAMPASRSEALQAIGDASTQLAELNKIHARTVALNAELSKLYEALSKKAADVGKLSESAGAGKGLGAGASVGAAAAGGGSSTDQFLQATKQMRETQMSFNLQYLQLQSQMQKENQQFETVSNVLKSKHDAAMAAINNIC